jgi:hypothetical protein
VVPRRVTLPGRPVSKTTVASLEPVRYAAYYDQGGPIPLFHRAEAINNCCTVAQKKHTQKQSKLYTYSGYFAERAITPSMPERSPSMCDFDPTREDYYDGRGRR